MKGPNSSTHSIDLFSTDPWRRMRGIGFLRLFRKRHEGCLPITNVVLCPGHVALRFQINTKGGLVVMTIVFDLLPEAYSMFKPSQKEMVQFDTILNDRSQVPSLPHVLTIPHKSSNLIFEGFLGPSLASGSVLRRFLVVTVDGNASMWVFLDYSWHVLQSFTAFEKPLLNERCMCSTGDMLYWATTLESSVDSVRARPISFEEGADSTESVVLGCELTLLKGFRLVDIFSSEPGFSVFLFQQSPTEPLRIYSNDRSGHVQMVHTDTCWTLSSSSSSSSSSYTTTSSVSPGSSNSVHLEANPPLKGLKSLVMGSGEAVDLFFTLKRRDLFVLEWGQTATCLYVYSGQPLRHKFLCQLLSVEVRARCLDFAVTTRFALLLVTSATTTALLVFDLRTGAQALEVPLPLAPAYTILPSFNPLFAFIASSSVDISAIRLPSSPFVGRGDLLQQMTLASQAVGRGELPQSIPSDLAPAVLPQYAEQLSHPPPVSLIARHFHLAQGVTDNKSKPLRVATALEQACRATLHGPSSSLQENPLSDQLLESVLPYLSERISELRSPSDEAESILSPDFLLSLGHNHFEITCRLLYELHPDLLGVYVKTVVEAQVSLHAVPPYSVRALQALPPTGTATPQQKAARATVLCLNDEVNAALSSLPSWTAALDFLHDHCYLTTATQQMFRELLIGCVVSNSEEKMKQLLSRRPRSFDEQCILSLVQELSSEYQPVSARLLKCILLQANGTASNTESP